MLNVVWITLMLAAVVIGASQHRLDQVVASVMTSATAAATLALGLVGIMSFWLGLMKLAENAGIVQGLAWLLRPVTRRLFPEIPRDHPALGAILLNVAANLLGLANAATPFGLRAMEELQTLNPHPEKATHAMCLFLAINTSSIQLLPATAIAILSLNGGSQASSIILPTLLATTASTVVAIGAAKLCAKFSRPKTLVLEGAA